MSNNFHNNNYTNQKKCCNGTNIYISASDTRQAISASNNKSRYYAELAEKYKNEAKELRDSAQYYAEQNSDVTMGYINELEVSLRNAINTKQNAGNYALSSDIPQDLSVLNNDTNFVNSTQLNSAVSTLQTNLNTLSSSVSIVTLQAIYPVGSVYIGTMSTCPLAALFGTWTKVSEGRVLWGSDENNEAGSTIAAGLPNITGTSRANCYSTSTPTGAFYGTNASSGALAAAGTVPCLRFDASGSSSVYGNSTTVQPPAYVVNIWERTA